MHPVMEVRRTTFDGKRAYELILSQENFNHLCAGCPDFDRLVGHADDGIVFYIFENPHGVMPEAFKILPEGNGYFAYVGAPMPRIPQGVINEEFCRLANEASGALEKAINESGRLPMEEETPNGKLHLGYVTMTVEKDSSLNNQEQ